MKATQMHDNKSFWDTLTALFFGGSAGVYTMMDNIMIQSFWPSLAEAVFIAFLVGAASILGKEAGGGILKYFKKKFKYKTK